MFRIEIHDQLEDAPRKQVHGIIQHTWHSEQLAFGDVTVKPNKDSCAVDRLDPISTHVLVYSPWGTLAAYGRISILSKIEDFELTREELEFCDIELPSAYFSRLVVHPNFRRHGISKMIHRIRVQIAIQNRCNVIMGSAVGKTAAKILQDMGFEILRDTRGFRCAWYETTRTTYLMSLRLTNFFVQQFNDSDNRIAN